MATQGVRGRWHLDYKDGCIEIRTHPGDQRGVLIARVPPQHDETGNNARLIAAAPVLQRVMANIRNMSAPGATVDSSTLLAIWSTACAALDAIEGR